VIQQHLVAELHQQRVDLSLLEALLQAALPDIVPLCTRRCECLHGRLHVHMLHNSASCQARNDRLENCQIASAKPVRRPDLGAEVVVDHSLCSLYQLCRP
jgi:hypothetical protein